MTRRTTFALGEFYHVYNRGVDKRIVFENESDYKRFMLLLHLCNGESPVRLDILNPKGSTSTDPIGNSNFPSIVSVGAFCLMPNHFHILLREITEGGISAFMHRLSTAFTMYFNAKNERSGALFQGRFKAEHANNDRYLKYLFSYIHLNPVKLVEPAWKEIGIQDKDMVKKYLLSYPYSSYLDYIKGGREASKIVDRDEFPDYFGSETNFENFIDDWLSYREQIM